VRFKVLEGRAEAEAEARAAALAERIRAEQLTTDEAWQQLADEDPAVVLNVSPPFASDGTVPGLGDDAELVRRLFAAKVGDVGGPRAVARGWVVWQLAEIKEAGVPPFDEVRDRVEQEVRRRLAVERAMAAAAVVASRWRAGEDPAVLAEQQRTTLQQATDHRRGTVVANLGLAPALDQAVFTASQGEIVGPVELKDRGAVVARVDRLQVATSAELAAERESVRARLESQRAGQLLDAVLNERRREAVVTINAELLERFAPRPRR
jgi:protein-disulfide isomerase-like protein with CxxC motif